MEIAELKGPFEPRKAATRLRDVLVDHLTTKTPSVGSPFYSDAELMQVSGLSRKTVRKALDELQREGWIERLAGKGSFIGPRVAVPLTNRLAKVHGGRRTVRMAVLAYGFAGAAPDWYSQGILDGIDQVALEHGVSVELIGSHTTEPSHVGQRLAQSRPDVLIAMPPSTRMALLIGEAERLGIPSIVADTRFLDMGVPAVCEDGEQGAAMAVKHFAAKGHKRIGLLQRPDTARWVFARREGYVKGLTENGLTPDERLVVWLSSDHARCEADAARLWEYLCEQRPTALLMASAWHAHTIGRLIREHGLRIPQDLSLISFDQHLPHYREFMGFAPTIVELPLQQMGRKLAEISRQIVEGRKVEPVTFLPCELKENDSVRDWAEELRTQESTS